jgi:predicted heme/steroid binding protein/uncharacterized membrane protein
LKVFTSEDLAQRSGGAGGEALVAADGRVYDVSKSAKWPNGVHMRRHKAGADLTADLQGAPHGPEVLERIPQVGVFEAKAATPVPGFRGEVDEWLNRHPFFRRHPHPAVVHFPVALFTILPLLQVCSLVTRSAYTEWAAFCCLLIGALALPAAIATGYFTWWINYERRDSRIIFAKRKLAWLALVIAIALVVIRIASAPNPLETHSGAVIAYTALTVAAGIVVSCIGYLGGRLTFPYED